MSNYNAIYYWPLPPKGIHMNIKQVQTMLCILITTVPGIQASSDPQKFPVIDGLNEWIAQTTSSAQPSRFPFTPDSQIPSKVKVQHKMECQAKGKLRTLVCIPSPYAVPYLKHPAELGAKRLLKLVEEKTMEAPRKLVQTFNQAGCQFTQAAPISSVIAIQIYEPAKRAILECQQRENAKSRQNERAERRDLASRQIVQNTQTDPDIREAEIQAYYALFRADQKVREIRKTTLEQSGMRFDMRRVTHLDSLILTYVNEIGGVYQPEPGEQFYELDSLVEDYRKIAVKQFIDQLNFQQFQESLDRLHDALKRAFTALRA
jgi:hypothetical protein